MQPLTPEQWHLVTANLRLIWWAAHRMGMRGQEADDAYDHGLSALMSAARRWQPERATFGWYAARGILSRLAKWRQRREGPARRLTNDVPGKPPAPDPPDIPLNSLPPREFEAVDRMYFRGQTQGEAGKGMGVCRTVIYRLHRRACDRLRERMETC